MRLTLILIGLLILMPEADAARWLWPWDAPHQRHRRHHPRLHQKATPDDCKRINEAVAFLSKAELDKELASLDKLRKQTIERCRREGVK